MALLCLHPERTSYVFISYVTFQNEGLLGKRSLAKLECFCVRKRKPGIMEKC